MLRQLFVFIFALLAFNATADIYPDEFPIDDFIALEIEKAELEQELFGTPTNGEDIISIASIEVLELDEELDLGFETAAYLPEDFNVKADINDIDWNTIVLYEIEEELDLGFDTAKYLPEGFDPNKGINDIDWSTVELYELEEELEIGFDTKKYLPKGFNPFKGMDCEASTVISFNHNTHL